MNDQELHEAMRNIASDEAKDIELIPGWNKQLPFFGWFWRDFDWEMIPLGRESDGESSGDKPIVGFMAKNKWYNDEYYCTESQSGIIKLICLSIAKEYSAYKVQFLTRRLQAIGAKADWRAADRAAIDARTRKDFMDGKYNFIMLKK